MQRPFKLSLVTLALGMLGACQKHAVAPPETAPTVWGPTIAFADQKDPPGLRIATVETNGVQVVSAPGRLGWDDDHTARIYAPFAGRIERLRASLGDRVRRGQVLAEVASGDIGQAQADLHKAEADLGVARAALERARELAEGGVIAQKDLLQAQADLARSTAERERARARLTQYGVAAHSIDQAVALVSPIDGVVVERSANPKAEVRTDLQGPPLYVISDPTTLMAILDVDETRLAAFRLGERVDIRSAAWPDDAFTATITSVGEAVDAATRMVKVRAKVGNADRRLKGEMFVTATIAQATTLPTVPADAVFMRGERAYVFAQLGPGRYERRAVRVRSAGPRAWLVAEGLARGDRVVVGGTLNLDQLLDAAK